MKANEEKVVTVKDLSSQAVASIISELVLQKYFEIKKQKKKGKSA
ncbi:hypothetical protein PB1_02595 [Bacillus methanolicus PB1]|uniref:Uncharacterized protein n=1 Tax=Bacillus methanolicus PB1 TaxID=997296 RepID=I3E5M1_BACMT|nr:hypothetical protein [Bacillus methanolicus]EIJ81792.1 hypothetical protein PB1_02595 [Bacillus methanolicus PB1]